MELILKITRAAQTVGAALGELGVTPADLATVTGKIFADLSHGKGTAAVIADLTALFSHKQIAA